MQKSDCNFGGTFGTDHSLANVSARNYNQTFATITLKWVNQSNSNFRVWNCNKQLAFCGKFYSICFSGYGEMGLFVKHVRIPLAPSFVRRRIVHCFHALESAKLGRNGPTTCFTKIHISPWPLNQIKWGFL